jgi:coenzyme F420-reducing hydrogenase beta subunit
MISICDLSACTGCGMCASICSKKAITLEEGLHGFLYPNIDQNTCINCGLCQKKCPSNQAIELPENIEKVYAAWSKNTRVRKESTSGGVFSTLADFFVSNGGLVVGVAWDNKLHPYHIIASSKEEIIKFRGSKYSQSNTSDIYNQVKVQLDKGKKVLFSGTPCQIAALKSFIGGAHAGLYTIDVVCHGVPSNQFLDKYYAQFNKPIYRIQLRKKDPFWDFSYVSIDFTDGTHYQALTIEDDYFNIFNVGYSLRSSCHECRYANTRRNSDITLADFWGFTAHNFATRNYNKGTSLILVNSNKGNELINSIQSQLFLEEATLQMAINGNKCLSEPFRIDDKSLSEFWSDYDEGMSIFELNKKYCANRFALPKHLWIRRLYYKWKWAIKK